jgi:monoamine oxidase
LANLLLVSCSTCSIVEKPKDANVDLLRFPTYGPLAITFDGTTHEGAPALVGFVCADAAVQWQEQSAERRRQQIIASLVRYFGAEAENYVDYFEKNWNSEPFNGGCPTYNVTTCSIMPDYARATREPFVNMHLCGTESATVWQGYMDGAVESGIRAANEVIYSVYRDEPGIACDYEKTYYYQDEITRKAVNESRKRSGVL